MITQVIFKGHSGPEANSSTYIYELSHVLAQPLNCIWHGPYLYTYEYVCTYTEDDASSL